MAVNNTGLCDDFFYVMQKHVCKVFKDIMKNVFLLTLAPEAKYCNKITLL